MATLRDIVTTKRLRGDGRRGDAGWPLFALLGLVGAGKRRWVQPALGSQCQGEVIPLMVVVFCWQRGQLLLSVVCLMQPLCLVPVRPPMCAFKYRSLNHLRRRIPITSPSSCFQPVDEWASCACRISRVSLDCSTFPTTRACNAQPGDGVVWKSWFRRNQRVSRISNPL